ncbi:pyruvate dehydrogenase complex dihydrolipoamide acetyltransferase component (E2) [Tulasnella sp. 419]|nr:pyruvate dehydrogenase complex dihydrolipoamide acetyltransferase component (E2) [Tulasnella sp. 418]KAG8965574.1 pyruvate dehydrogenase complex dihydrolipoamide acetyltransferase component (E2) [Tulasnella sp. 419]
MSAVARAILTRRFHVSARSNALSKFSMPAMSPTMTEGGIAHWKKKEGETFTAGDVLLEIETDKATMDVEAQDDGVLAKIIVGDGSKGVKVGSTIAVMAEEGDDLSGAAQFAAEQSSEPEPPKEEPKKESAPAPAPSEPKKTEAPAKAESSSKSELAAGTTIFATPIAKKIALEKGIPLAKVKGTGPEGRITRQDVEAFKPSAAAATPAAAGPAAAEYTDSPVSNMRKTIGTRLTQSKQELPHYYVTVDIDMGRVNKLREVFNKSLAEKEGGAKLSVNDFITKAAALALKDVPDVNCAWLGDTIRQYHKADISMAVSTPTGLITPIIKDVGAKGLAAISAESKTLAKKARDGKLAPAEYQGGSFTISNLGMFGVSHFTAIINPPQSAILAVGTSNATIVPAPHEEKGWEVKQIMKATLSADHRVVDGAVAARWLAAFKSYLENPLSFML